MDASVTDPCPCGRGEAYGECCGRFHRGEAGAPTPELLMRSRYSAFAVGDAAYLLRTWHSVTRPDSLSLDRRTRWLRLVVLQSTGGVLDDHGTVEFEAHYDVGGQAGTLHEHSTFAREDGRWTYVGQTGEVGGE